MKFLKVGTTAYALTMTAASFNSWFVTGSVATASEERRMQTSCTACKFGQFCGSTSDFKCHDFSCQNYFQKGPWNDEGVGNSALVCEDYANSSQDGHYAVVYGCNSYFNQIIPSGKGLGLGFNRKCSATVAMQLFECYDLNPDTDMSSFLNLVSTSTPPTCGAESDFPQPGFIYQAELGRIKTTLNSTATFDASVAALAMRTVVTELTSAPKPNPTATSPAPAPAPVPQSAPSSSATTMRPTYTMATFVGLIVAPIMMQSLRL